MIFTAKYPGGVKFENIKTTDALYEIFFFWESEPNK